MSIHTKSGHATHFSGEKLSFNIQVYKIIVRRKRQIYRHGIQLRVN